jgi:hypothetical protein
MTAPTRTPHMISTFRTPGHAPTLRKITESLLNGYFE